MANDADEAALIRCHCLAHGRRKFAELEDVFPQECAVVMRALAQVVDPEDEAQRQQLKPTERLAYHQDASGPSLEALKHWLEQQCTERTVEPSVPGAPRRRTDQQPGGASLTLRGPVAQALPGDGQ